MSDPLEDLLQSPLDERPPTRRWWPWIGNVAAVAAITGIVLAVTGEFVAPTTTAGAPTTMTGDTGSPTESTTQASTSTTTVLVTGWPEARIYGAMAPVPASERLVLFGGSVGQQSTAPFADGPWMYVVGETGWLALDDSAIPEARVGHAMAGVPGRGVALYGGAGRGSCLPSAGVGSCSPAGFHDELWLFGESGWEALPSSDGPGLRAGHGLAYHAASDRLVLFGGLAPPQGSERSASVLGDTWMYDLATGVWQEVASAAGPSARIFPGLVTDEATGDLLLWGGLSQGTDGDPAVWRFDGSGWMPLDVDDDPAPEARSSHILVAEPQSGLVVMMGGTWFEDGQRAFGSDVWVFDPVSLTWEPRAGLEGPLAWSQAAAPGDGSVVVFAGDTGVYDPVSDQWQWTSPPD